MKYTDEKVHSYEKRLFEYNIKDLTKRNHLSNNGSVLVIHSLVHELNFNVLESIVANKIATLNNCDVFSIQFKEFRKSIELLDLSYGITPYYIDWNTCNIEKEKITEEFLKKYLSQNDKKSLISHLEYRGVKYGDVLYSEVIRKSVMSVENDAIRSEKDFILWMKTALNTIDYAYDFFETKKCHSLVVCEWGYICGLFARVGQEFGVDVYVVDIFRSNYLAKISAENKLFESITITDVTKSKANSNIEKPEEVNELFILQRDDYKKSLNIKKNGKKNVFILPHAFTDNSRTGDHMDIYFNYYEWFIDTLDIIKNIKNINWYIKDHPESRQYRQGELMQRIKEKYPYDHLTWLDKEYSGNQIAECADCVVTCAGDAGIEYWAQGIPTITAANAYYVDWGISYNAKDKEEYKKLLMKAGDLKKPTKESVKMSKEKLLKSNIYHGHGNMVLDIFYDTRKKQLEWLRNDSVQHENYIFYEFTKRLCSIDDYKMYDKLGSDSFDVSIK